MSIEQDLMRQQRQPGQYGNPVPGQPQPAPMAQSTIMPVADPVKSNAGQMTEQQQDLINQAGNFRKNASGYATEAFKPIEAQGKRQLAENISGINTGAQSRGLLYSGLRQKAVGEQYGNTAADLASKRMSLNQSFSDSARDMENEAIQGGLDIRASKQQQEDALYQRALANAQMRNQQNQQLFGTALQGIGIGAALA